MKALSRFRLPISVLLTFLLIFTFSFPKGSHAATLKTNVKYVSLGDSLAAGQTPNKTIDKSYADFLSDQLKQAGYNVTTQKFGVPGYTTKNLYTQILQDTNVRNSIDKSNIVTVDIGANDLLQVPGILSGNASPKAIDDAVWNAYLYTVLTVGEIKYINPKTQIYLMGYYNPFLRLQLINSPLAGPFAALLNQLNNNISQASKMYPSVYYVPTAEVFSANIQNYLRYVPNPADIHLSLEGYQVVGNQFFQKIVSVNALPIAQ